MLAKFVLALFSVDVLAPFPSLHSVLFLTQTVYKDFIEYT